MNFGKSGNPQKVHRGYLRFWSENCPELRNFPKTRKSCFESTFLVLVLSTWVFKYLKKNYFVMLKISCFFEFSIFSMIFYQFLCKLSLKSCPSYYFPHLELIKGCSVKKLMKNLRKKQQHNPWTDNHFDESLVWFWRGVNSM